MPLTGKRSTMDAFLKRLKAEAPGLEPADREVMRLVWSWHHFPELDDVLQFEGLNLGEMLEWAVTPGIISALGRAGETTE